MEISWSWGLVLEWVKSDPSGSNRRLGIWRKIMAEKSAELTVCARERDKKFRNQRRWIVV
jgi:hypothetical protein